MLREDIQIEDLERQKFI